MSNTVVSGALNGAKEFLVNLWKFHSIDVSENSPVVKFILSSKLKKNLSYKFEDSSHGESWIYKYKLGFMYLYFSNYDHCCTISVGESG